MHDRQQRCRTAVPGPGVVTTTRVAWRRSDGVPTDEVCTLTLRESGLSLVGTVLGAEGGLPLRVEYRILADPRGYTGAVHVRDLRGFEQRTLELVRDGRGRWTENGQPAQALSGCSDVDLGCSPSTNTLPIRRLRLRIGERRTIQAAWVRFPGLTVEKVAQAYSRLDERTYHYASGSFEADLTVDDDGLVTEYGVWRRTAFAAGPEDSEPLDGRR